MNQFSLRNYFQAGGARLRVEFPTATSERMAGEMKRECEINVDCGGISTNG